MIHIFCIAENGSGHASYALGHEENASGHAGVISAHAENGSGHAGGISAHAGGISVHAENGLGFESVEAAGYAEDATRIEGSAALFLKNKAEYLLSHDHFCKS